MKYALICSFLGLSFVLGVRYQDQEVKAKVAALEGQLTEAVEAGKKNAANVVKCVKVCQYYMDRCAEALGHGDKSPTRIPGNDSL